MRQDILMLFAGQIRWALEQAKIEDDQLEEIRLRVNQPLICRVAGKEIIVMVKRNRIMVTAQQLKETFSYISQYSYYAFAEEISRGYLTVPGGHRVGICGKAIWEDGRCKGMRYISFLNVRVAHQVKGCGEAMLPQLYRDGKILHTLIISPPGAGKTTLMRDLIRLISEGNPFGDGANVSVVDERSELAACYQGVPQHDLGPRCDILDGCEKATGIMMVIRSMNPQVVAVDEIGGKQDVEAISEAARCGCTILATAHGESMEEIREKPYLGQLIREGLFERYLFLSGKNGPGQVVACLDRQGKEVIRDAGRGHLLSDFSVLLADG